MTPVDIDKLKELLTKATPTPWVRANLANITTKFERGDNYTAEQTAYRPEDDILTTAAVNSLPALIAKAERVDALMDLVRRAQLNVPQYYVEWHEAARNALSPKESEK